MTTLVFDEVDTGVSGRAAQKVARKDGGAWGRSKQVLCVTHLPQIAAMADVHFSVEKGSGTAAPTPRWSACPSSGGRRSWHVSLAGRSSRTPS